MDNINFKISHDMREKIINLINSLWEWYNGFIKKVSKWFRNIYNSLDWIKYERYLKYQKRVKNRFILFAKRKRKYGK